MSFPTSSRMPRCLTAQQGESPPATTNASALNKMLEEEGVCINVSAGSRDKLNI